LNTAWIGFVGVVVGGVVVAFSTYGTERWRTSAARAAEAQRERIHVKQAARVIDSQLQRAEIAVTSSLEHHKWWIDDVELTTDAWPTYRDVLASKLSLQDWVAVLAALQAVSDLRGRRAAQAAVTRAKMLSHPETKGMLEAAERLSIDVVDPLPPMSEPDVATLQHPLRAIIDGRSALASLHAD
jgi:hypothetical protein